MIAGAITSFIVVATIMVGATRNKQPGLPFRVDGCANETLTSRRINGTIPAPPSVGEVEEKDTFILFKLSMMYYTFVGVVIVFLVAYLVSVLTGGYEVKDERLFTPFVRRKVKAEQEMQITGQDVKYLNIEAAKKVLESKSEL